VNFRPKIYESQSCSKPINVMLSGSWPQVLFVKNIIANESEHGVPNLVFLDYVTQVSAQIVRSIWKKASKYLYHRQRQGSGLSRCCIMKHWEVYSGELGASPPTSSKLKAHQSSVFKKIGTDPATVVSLVSLMTSQSELNSLLTKLFKTPEEVLEAANDFTASFLTKYLPVSQQTYNNTSYLEFVSTILIDNETLDLSINWATFISNAIKEVRLDSNSEAVSFYSSFPLSFCVNSSSSFLDREISERMKELWEMLERVRLLRSSDHPLSQYIINSKVNDAVRLKADIIVSGNGAHSNVLYILSPRKTLDLDDSAPTHS
jgi:hypothetical protein